MNEGKKRKDASSLISDEEENPWAREKGRQEIIGGFGGSALTLQEKKRGHAQIREGEGSREGLVDLNTPLALGKFLDTSIQGGEKIYPHEESLRKTVARRRGLPCKKGRTEDTAKHHQLAKG